MERLPSYISEAGDPKLQTSISDIVCVYEREFRNYAIHQDDITGIINMPDKEFLTCGKDMTFKIWDK